MRQVLLMATVMLLCSSRAFSEDENITKTPSQQKILSSLNGRFVFGQISEYRRDQFLLDTQTGRLWRIVSDKTDNQFKLEPIPFMQIYGGDAYIPDLSADVESHRKYIRKKAQEEPDKSN